MPTYDKNIFCRCIWISILPFPRVGHWPTIVTPRLLTHNISYLKSDRSYFTHPFDFFCITWFFSFLYPSSHLARSTRRMTDSSKIEYTVEEKTSTVEYTVEEKITTTEKQGDVLTPTTTIHDTKGSEAIVDVSEEFDKNGDRIYVKSAAERALVRKLDFIYVMPFVAVLNFLQVHKRNTMQCQLNLVSSRARYSKLSFFFSLTHSSLTSPP